VEGDKKRRTLGGDPERSAAMTARERADRNFAVFEARVRGIAWARIATEHGISERQAQRLYAEQRENRPSLASRDPVEAVEELLDGYDAALEDLALLGRDTSHDGTRLGAIRGRLDVIRAKYELLAAVGVLPADLGRLSVEIDVRRTMDTMIEVLERHGVDEAVFDELLDVFDGP
jgi:hypothetical protein